MSSVVISGNTSGSVSLVAPDVAGSSVQTLTSVSGTLAPLVSGTAVTASGTSIDFTSIPSWVKRITVMFDGVSLSGTSNGIIQIGGSGGIETTGYSSTAAVAQSATTSAIVTSTAGFLFAANWQSNTDTFTGVCRINLIDGTKYILDGMSTNSAATRGVISCGSKSLTTVLDRIRITTVNGTDTFDAGTINIMYE